KSTNDQINSIEKPLPEIQKEIEVKEELIAEFEEDSELSEEITEEMKKKIEGDKKFWQKPPYNSLLDPELLKDSTFLNQDFTPIIHKFFEKMLKEDFINFRISGMAILGAATIHHTKIKDVIEHEQKIQQEQEIQELRERTRRSIPKAFSQPIQPKKKVATREELFSAMRSAILETMQKREKLRRARERREEAKQLVQFKKSKARLPKELLKHITGKEQTIEELIDGWYNKIKASLDLNDTDYISFFELLNLIKNEQEDTISRKFALVRMFLSLMFLGTSNKINIFQAEDFEDISITIK
ncbi:MAG: hypothetical protein KAX33_12420, partial [Candidatus Lokiarchaeota archaeon]|nr:hypothetical protein [Candidatus Lokiarchaeota archaeon]